MWTRFWREFEVAKHAVGYHKGLGQGSPALVESYCGDPRIQIVGLVIDSVDSIMHGMQLGAAGMHNQIRQWAETGYLATVLDILHSAGFSIWLTSDHGNIEAFGIGQPTEQALAEIRGGRARVYSTPELRKSIRSSFGAGDEWPPIGLPNGYYPLLAAGRTAFAARNEIIVGHGGATIEEMIVPLIEIE